MKHLDNPLPPELSPQSTTTQFDFNIWHELVNEIRVLTGRKPFEKKELSAQFNILLNKSRRTPARVKRQIEML